MIEEVVFLQWHRFKIRNDSVNLNDVIGQCTEHKSIGGIMVEYDAITSS
jgi:hypothetical protein